MGLYFQTFTYICFVFWPISKWLDRESRQSLREGQVYYLVSMHWWNIWLDYVYGTVIFSYFYQLHFVRVFVGVLERAQSFHSSIILTNLGWLDSFVFLISCLLFMRYGYVISASVCNLVCTVWLYNFLWVLFFIKLRFLFRCQLEKNILHFQKAFASLKPKQGNRSKSFEAADVESPLLCNDTVNAIWNVSADLVPNGSLDKTSNHLNGDLHGDVSSTSSVSVKLPQDNELHPPPIDNTVMLAPPTNKVSLGVVDSRVLVPLLVLVSCL